MIIGVKTAKIGIIVMYINSFFDRRSVIHEQNVNRITPRNPTTVVIKLTHIPDLANISIFAIINKIINFALLILSLFVIITSPNSFYRYQTDIRMTPILLLQVSHPD